MEKITHVLQTSMEAHNEQYEPAKRIVKQRQRRSRDERRGAKNSNQESFRKLLEERMRSNQIEEQSISNVDKIILNGEPPIVEDGPTKRYRRVVRTETQMSQIQFPYRVEPRAAAIEAVEYDREGHVIKRARSGHILDERA